MAKEFSPSQPSLPQDPCHTQLNTTTHTRAHVCTHTYRVCTPYLPFSAFLVAGELEQRDRVVELPELQEGAAGAAQPPAPPGTLMGEPREMHQDPQLLVSTDLRY